jgi:hypothetical protein
VFADGVCYVIDPRRRELKQQIGGAIARVWEVSEPRGLVCGRQGIAFLRIGPAAVAWHTRRLSWDGSRDVMLTTNRITGLAWKYDDTWVPFEVNLITGASQGGSIQKDDLDWETLASD